MSFGKMATLLFGLAGVLALINFTMLPDAPSLAALGGGGSGGHVVTNHAQGEDPSIDANRGLEEARARRAALPVDFGAGSGDTTSIAEPGAMPPGGAPSDELPNAGQERVQPQPGAAPNQPAVAPPPKIQAAPQVSFIPGQPMMDTNPSR